MTSFEKSPGVKAFASNIEAQFDAAVSADGMRTYEEYNNGLLHLPINDENLTSATWETFMPQLPGEVAILSPFDTGDPIELSTRYRYGGHMALINIWFNNRHDEDFRSLAFNLAINPKTGEEQLGFGSNMSIAGGHGETIKTDSQLAHEVLGIVFNNNQQFMQAPSSLSLADRYLLGVMTQPEYGAEAYTQEKVGKLIGVPSRNRNVDHLSGFDLSVKIINRAHPNQKLSRVALELAQHFDGKDFLSGTLFEGRLVRLLEYSRDENDVIASINRGSYANLMNEPIPMIINGKEQLVATGDMHQHADKRELPDEIRRHLYDDTQPTMEDLAFFEKIVTQPIAEDDLYL